MLPLSSVLLIKSFNELHFLCLEGNSFIIVSARHPFSTRKTQINVLIRNGGELWIHMIISVCVLRCIQVSREEGVALASRWDCPFFETSAALRHYVDDAFHSIIRQIRHREHELSPTSGTTAGSHCTKNRKKTPNGIGRDFGKVFQKIFRWNKWHIVFYQLCTLA